MSICIHKRVVRCWLMTDEMREAWQSMALGNRGGFDCKGGCSLFVAFQGSGVGIWITKTCMPVGTRENSMMQNTSVSIAKSGTILHVTTDHLCMPSRTGLNTERYLWESAYSCRYYAYPMRMHLRGAHQVVIKSPNFSLSPPFHGASRSWLRPASSILAANIYQRSLS